MASPFRRKKAKEGVEDDIEIIEVVDEEQPEDSLENGLDDREIQIEDLLESAKQVTHTCMDIRRGENVLIVCDPTTGEIGQALHQTATQRSERVLLIVMPKGRHHGEEPPAPVAISILVPPRS